MEKRLNKKIETYITDFKDNIRNKINTLSFEEQNKINELLEFVYDYNRLQLQKDDLVKRIRVKNAIPDVKRCSAKRCNGEQCTRTKKNDSLFCGTHIKGTPHGLIEINNNKNVNTSQKVNIFVQEIYGIHYYIDNFENVYKTEDILLDKQNPKIIGKYKKENDKYTIIEFSANL
jgi:hypothetical protein